MKTTDYNQNKQLTELTEEEIKKVTGGVKIERPSAKGCMAINEDKCPYGTTLDKFGCKVCL